MDSWVPSFIDSLFQSTFLASLLLFWLCIYHALRQNERKLIGFYLIKLFLVGFLWLVVIIASTLQKHYELNHPLYSAPAETNHFYVFKICFFSAGGLYILYLAYLIIRASTELRAMPFFDVRLRFMSYLLVCVVCVVFGITATRFGLGVLEDNFAADLSTRYTSSVQFMTFYGLINVYLLTMAYVYSPSDRAVLGEL